MRVWLSASLLCFPMTAAAAELEGEAIEIGIRGSGSHADRELGLERARVIHLDSLPLAKSQRFDAQVGERRSYLGVDLQELLTRYPYSAEFDLALLHFSNGMIVPVPLAFGRPLLAVFVARGTFPDLAKPNVLAPDPRPITFGANKIVVPELAHPYAPDPDRSSFSPWSHVDTLIAIELVDRAAWEQQFGAGPGRAVFLARCQFCHAVREVGGKYGWDFVEPTPIFEYRKPHSLYPHVRFTNSIAQDQGAMMPPQKDVTRAELDALWKWMKEMAETGPQPYAAVH